MAYKVQVKIQKGFQFLGLHYVPKWRQKEWEEESECQGHVKSRGSNLIPNSSRTNYLRGPTVITFGFISFLGNKGFQRWQTGRLDSFRTRFHLLLTVPPQRGSLCIVRWFYRSNCNPLISTGRPICNPITVLGLVSRIWYFHKRYHWAFSRQTITKFLWSRHTI